MTGHKNLFLLFSVTLVASMLALDQYQEDNPSELIIISAALLLLFKSKIARSLAQNLMKVNHDHTSVNHHDQL